MANVLGVSLIGEYVVVAEGYGGDVSERVVIVEGGDG